MINWGIPDFLWPEYILHFAPLHYNMDILESLTF